MSISDMMRLLLVMAITASCSFATVVPPPSDHAQRPVFECTSGRSSVLFDGLVTTVSLYEMTGALKDAPADRDQALFATMMGVFALAFGTSIYYGLTRTHRCRNAQRAQRARLLRMPAPTGLCGGYQCAP